MMKMIRYIDCLKKELHGCRSVKELQELNFKVVGINGWKKLRGYKSLIKYRPIPFWSIISNLTQKITYHYPRLAFELFGIKKIGWEGEK